MGYESSIDAFNKELAKNRIKFLESAGILLKSQGRLLCPVGTPYGGTLRQDIDYSVSQQFESVQVGNRLEYAIYVNKGTGIHAADGDGRQTPWVYYDAKSDRYYQTHGQKPQPYLEESFKVSKSDLIKLAAKILSVGE